MLLHYLRGDENVLSLEFSRSQPLFQYLTDGFFSVIVESSVWNITNITQYCDIYTICSRFFWENPESVCSELHWSITYRKNVMTELPGVFLSETVIDSSFLFVVNIFYFKFQTLTKVCFLFILQWSSIFHKYQP